MDEKEMRGKLIIVDVDRFSSRFCSGRFDFEIIGEGEDPDLTDLEVEIEIPPKPKWIGKQKINEVD